MCHLTSSAHYQASSQNIPLQFMSLNFIAFFLFNGFSKIFPIFAVFIISVPSALHMASAGLSMWGTLPPQRGLPLILTPRVEYKLHKNSTEPILMCVFSTYNIPWAYNSLWVIFVELINKQMKNKNAENKSAPDRWTQSWLSLNVMFDQ